MADLFRSRYRRALIGALGLVLIGFLSGGCADKTFSINDHNREQVISHFVSGQISLNREVSFILADVGHRDRMSELYKLQQWENLARLVIETGWEVDRNYYFLGRSAEEIGARDAAITYYRRALSRPPQSQCVTSRTCVGIDVPRRSSERLAALERPVRIPASRR